MRRHPAAPPALRAAGTLALAICAALAALAWPVPALAQTGESITLTKTSLEFGMGLVALGNLLLGITAWLSARAKAASSKLEALEEHLRAQMQRQDESINWLRTRMEAAPTHEHLAELYRDIKAIGEQVHVLLGQQRQMNDNLRLMLDRMVSWTQ